MSIIILLKHYVIYFLCSITHAGQKMFLKTHFPLVRKCSCSCIMYKVQKFKVLVNNAQQVQPLLFNKGRSLNEGPIQAACRWMVGISLTPIAVEGLPVCLMFVWYRSPDHQKCPPTPSPTPLFVCSRQSQLIARYVRINVYSPEGHFHSFFDITLVLGMCVFCWPPGHYLLA